MEKNSVTVSFDTSVSVNTEIQNRIVKALEDVLPIAVARINATDIDILVDFEVALTIPEIGIGGSTETPHVIRISINTDHKNIEEHLEREIKSTVVHELHHAMRNRIYPWPGTLLDDIVGEGLADHFDIEINGGNPKVWSLSLSETQLTTVNDIASSKWSKQNTEQDYYNWMHGSKELGIPKWAGYALGFKIVEEYMQKTGKRASDLVKTPSDEFITISTRCLSIEGL